MSVQTFEDAPASQRQRNVALAMCLTLGAIATAGGFFGAAPEHHNNALLPLAAAIWSFADALTAFLLLAQFYVTGRLSFAVLALAYALSALLTWTYLSTFPGIFSNVALTPAEQQIALYIWTAWHLTFPGLALLAVLFERNSGRLASAPKIRLVTAGVVAVACLGAFAISFCIIAFRASLPQLIAAGHFLPPFRALVLPFAIVVNGLACVAIVRLRPLSALWLWLTVAMFSELVDVVLNAFSPARFSYAWAIGKLVTVSTASIVLIMMLCGVAVVYARLAKSAKTDVLTRLPNRRAFDEHFATVFQNARRIGGSMGLLVVDIDFFKRYNDTHGHLAGDDCLRQVAAVMARCATRPLDLVCRYGGEEFTVILPDTPLEGVLIVAERIRASLARVDLVHCDQTLGRITVSVGAAFAQDARASDQTTLFEAADRALYAAKTAGRDRISADGARPQRADEAAPVVSSVGVVSLLQPAAAQP